MKCPLCLKHNSEFNEVKISEEEYMVCEFCYHVITTLRKKKKFEVEIQKFEVG
jgi:ribosome-binding protein aMBF1 (putative translation factor)